MQTRLTEQQGWKILKWILITKIVVLLTLMISYGRLFERLDAIVSPKDGPKAERQIVILDRAQQQQQNFRVVLVESDEEKQVRNPVQPSCGRHHFILPLPEHHLRALCLRWRWYDPPVGDGLPVETSLLIREELERSHVLAPEPLCDRNQLFPELQPRLTLPLPSER